MTKNSLLTHDDPSISPFLKWAGGKRWFADRCLHMVPENYDRYVEPFLGSGAMFFALRPEKALLSDLNADLINCYTAIRDTPEKIVSRLAKYQRLHGKEYYYEARSRKPKDSVQLAAWFIYLNRTCWNGLYRVNRKNEFNVPIGTKTSVVLPTDDFVRTGQLFRNVALFNRDFEATLEEAVKGDFVFVDPPYTVRHNLNGFVKYNDRIFSWDDQVRLRDAVARAAKRGAKVLVTNANHASIREIYEGLGEFQVVARASVLAAKSLHRSLTEELVIRTWIKKPRSIVSPRASKNGARSQQRPLP